MKIPKNKEEAQSFIVQWAAVILVTYGCFARAKTMVSYLDRQYPVHPQHTVTIHRTK